MLMSLALIAMPLMLMSCSSGDDSEDIDTPNQDKTEIRHNVSIETYLKILLGNNINELVKE